MMKLLASQQAASLLAYFITMLSTTVYRCTSVTTVRLVNGYGKYEGRVEVYHNGEWGTVCDDEWDLNDAQVVCRQLGFGQAIGIKTRAFFGQGSGQIWLDNVNCTGTELTIEDCSHNGWGNENCYHSEDVGVQCIASDGIVRLVDGPTSHEGRVEVYHNGEWGTVCDDGWDLNDSQVVCRQLGFNLAVNARSTAYYGQGSGQIWLNSVTCVGNESTIENCLHDGWGVHNCIHSKDAGVECAALHVRLVNGYDKYEGRVEVYYDGEWGTVCDNRWDLNDAQVVCRQLGFGPAIVARDNAFYGRSDYTVAILLDNVACVGTESTIEDCSHDGWGVQDCYHNQDAGVQCSASDGLVRLVDGSTSYEGRVEVYHNGEWGTVCDDGWDLNDAQVVCRQLGYDLTNNTITIRVSAYYGQGSGQILLNNVNCVGNESTIEDCSHDGWGIHDCFHREDAGVKCATSYVRLIGGYIKYEGRVEVYHNGKWGSVCTDDWDLNDAQVVCRELGIGPAIASRSKEIYGRRRFSWLNNVDCVGTESVIEDCSHNVWGIVDCSQYEDAGVQCSALDGVVRLVNGPTSYEGRVEVYHNGEWGTVCDDGWDLNDAQVVCRQLGFDSTIDAIHARSDAFYGQGSGQIWLNKVNCNGNESTIENCSHDGWGIHSCTHAEDASVKCTTAFVRLVNAPNKYEGRVEINYGGVWGTVCDNKWDLNDAQVVCRQLGFGPAINVRNGAYYGQGSGITWLNNVTCVGTESTVEDCTHNGWGNEDCFLNDDAGVQCSASDGVVRLVGGPTSYEGRVEVYHNGEWGTVCDDGWDLNDTQVVCRQLGFDLAIEARSGAYYGQGSGQLWLNNVTCVGNESTIEDCLHDGWGVHDCFHSKDAGVKCAASNEYGDLRIFGNGSIGKLEFWYNTWASVCKVGFDYEEARVACRQLGYDDGNLYYNRSAEDYPNDEEHFVVCSSSCYGSERRLANCALVQQNCSSCIDNYPVHITCYDLSHDDNNSVVGYIAAGLFAFIFTSVLVMGIIVTVIIRKNRSVKPSPQATMVAVALPPQTSTVQYSHQSDPSQAEVSIQSYPNSAQQQTSLMPAAKGATCTSADVRSTSNSSVSPDDDKPAMKSVPYNAFDGESAPDGSTNDQSNSYSNTFTT